MKKVAFYLFLFSLPFSIFGQDNAAVKIEKNVPQLSTKTGEIVAKVKLAKEYFMESTDPAAGKDFEERTNNLSKRISTIFKNFRTERNKEYSNVRIELSSFDWATGHTATKTAYVPDNMYTFFKMVRTTNGDWKGGPTIKNIDRSGWFEGDIPGGSVTWKTGGHGKARTNWTISARYEDAFISKTIESEMDVVKKLLNDQKLPTE